MATSFSHLDENHAFVAKSLEFHESKGAGKSWTCKLCNSPGLVFANANYVAVKHVAEECPSEAYKNKYGEPTKNGRGEILYSDVAKIGNSLDPEFWKPLLVTYRALVAKEREIDAPLDAPPLPDNTFINFGLDDGPILCSPGDEDEYTSESESGGDSPKTAIGDEDLLQTYEFPFTPPWVLNDSDQEKWRDCRYCKIDIPNFSNMSYLLLIHKT